MLASIRASASKALVITLFLTGVQGFWRMPCLSRSGLARIDPLVNFGSLSQHAHAIHGSSGFSETSTWPDLIGGDCTSCQVSQDKSAYWTPALYFQDSATGKFELVGQQGGMLAYYLLYPNSNDPSNTIHAFPEGFQMIAGDTYQRNFSYPVPDIPKSLWIGPYAEQSFLRQAAVGFNCLNYAKDQPEPSLSRHTWPDKSFTDANCADGIRAELMFPSCWSGKNDSANHKDHVAYPSQVMTGDCPADFPMRLPSLFYETIWRTQDFVGRAGKFLFSNGDPTGCGYHGDFIMGWQEEFLQSAVDQCRNPSGRIEDCALFNIQDADVYGNCNIKEPDALASEKVIGTATDGLETLPGNPAIMAGPGYAKGAVVGGSGSNPVPSPVAAPILNIATPAAPIVAPIIPASPTSSAVDVPGAVFAIQTSTSVTPEPAAPTPEPATPTPEPETPTPAPVAPAPTPAPAAPEQVDLGFFSTDYKTSGHTVEEILWVEEVATVTVPYAGRAKRHLHKHRAQN